MKNIEAAFQTTPDQRCHQFNPQHVDVVLTLRNSQFEIRPENRPLYENNIRINTNESTEKFSEADLKNHTLDEDVLIEMSARKLT